MRGAVHRLILYVSSDYNIQNKIKGSECFSFRAFLMRINLLLFRNFNLEYCFVLRNSELAEKQVTEILNCYFLRRNDGEFCGV